MASGVRDAEEARHRKRHGGVYYRRTVDIGVKGHEKSRGYSADMLTYIQGGEEYLYDIVRIRENPSLVSALAAEGNGGYEILSTKSDGEGNVPHGTQRIVPQGGRGAQGGGLRPSIRRQSEAADAALRAVEGSAVVQGDPLEAHSRNLMKATWLHRQGDVEVPDRGASDYGGKTPLKAKRKGGVRVADEGERQYAEADDAYGRPGAAAAGMWRQCPPPMPSPPPRQTGRPMARRRSERP